MSCMLSFGVPEEQGVGVDTPPVVAAMQDSQALGYPGLKYFIVRRSYVELQKTHLAAVPLELDSFGGEKRGFKWNKNDHQATYPNGSLGFYAQCASEEDTRKVLGAEAGLIVFDESPELQWDWLMLMAASARAPKTPRYRADGAVSGESLRAVHQRALRVFHRQGRRARGWRHLRPRRVALADPDTPGERWQLDQLALKERAEQIA